MAFFNDGLPKVDMANSLSRMIEKAKKENERISEELYKSWVLPLFVTDNIEALQNFIQWLSALKPGDIIENENETIVVFENGNNWQKGYINGMAGKPVMLKRLGKKIAYSFGVIPLGALISFYNYMNTNGFRIDYPDTEGKFELITKMPKIFSDEE